MAERVRSDLGFKPLYASLSFSELSTAVVYDTKTQQLHFGALSGSEGSYDIDFAANNIFASGNGFFEGTVTANGGFVGSFNITTPDETILFTDTNVIGGLSNFSFNKSSTNPIVTLRSGDSSTQKATFIITGSTDSLLELASENPRITFKDNNYASTHFLLRHTESIRLYSSATDNLIQFELQSGSVIAPGEVSASGHLYASLSFDNSADTDNLVAYDVETGQLFLTNSLQNIDSSNTEIIFNDLGHLTGSSKFTFVDLFNINSNQFEPTVRLRSDTQRVNLFVSSSTTGSLIAYGKARGRLELRNSFNNNGDTNAFYIEAYEVGTNDKPNTLRFSNAPGGNQGIHMRFSNGPMMLAKALYAVSSAIDTPYIDSGFAILPGGVVADQISCSGDITGSTFFASGNLGNAQFIGTASWALSASYVEGAAGNDTEVQFNDGGQLAGSTHFTFNKSTGQPEIKLQSADGPTNRAILRLSGSSTAGFAGVVMKAAQTYFVFTTGSTDSDRLFFTSNGYDIMSLGDSATPTSNNIKFLPLAGDISASGGYFSDDVTILGTASINYLHTIYESSSVIYSSGSTKFGDTDDDTHQRTGSMFISGAQFTIPSGSITASDALIERNADGGDVVLTVFNSNPNALTDKHAGIEFKHAAVIGDERNAGKIIAGKDDTYGGAVPYTNNASSNLQFYTAFQGGDYKRLHISSLGHITASGVFSSSAAGVNLIGTASFATASVSSSYALTSSFSENAATISSGSTSVNFVINAEIGTNASFELDSFVTSSNEGASYTYNIVSTESGSRTGTFLITHWSGTLEFTDFSTNHIGPETQRPNFTAKLTNDTVSMEVENGNGYRYRAVVQKL